MTALDQPKPGEKGYNPWRDKGQWRAAGLLGAIGIPAVLGWGWYEMAKIDRRYASADSQGPALVTSSGPPQTAQLSEVYAAGMTIKDVDQLTTYAVILGRASACGVSTSDAAGRVGAWIDAKMREGAADRATLLPIFIQGVQSHADLQASGRSPDSCDQVREQFALMRWP